MSEGHKYKLITGIVENELWLNATGLPLTVDHDRGNPVGTVIHSWIGVDGKTRIVARIFVDTAHGRHVFINIEQYENMFLGYSTGGDNPPIPRDVALISNKCK